MDITSRLSCSKEEIFFLSVDGCLADATCPTLLCNRPIQGNPSWKSTHRKLQGQQPKRNVVYPICPPPMMSHFFPYFEIPIYRRSSCSESLARSGFPFPANGHTPIVPLDGGGRWALKKALGCARLYSTDDNSCSRRREIEGNGYITKTT